MKFWKKGLTAAALLAMATVALTAYGGSNEKKATKKSEDGKTELTVTTWNYDMIPKFEELFRASEAENPDVAIKPVDTASDDYDTKVATVLSSGDATDVLTMKNLPSYSNYALRNQLVDLTDHVEDLDIEPAKANYEMYEIDGKAYTQPYRINLQVLYYNKKMFDEAGVAYPDNLTWNEYEALAKKSSKPEGQVCSVYRRAQRSTV